MKLKVTLCNKGREFDQLVVQGKDESETSEAAKAALLEMLETVPYLAHADKWLVTVTKTED